MRGVDTDRTTFTGQIVGNVGTLTIDGGERTVLTNTNNTFIGNVEIVNNSTLQLGLVSSGANRIADTANVDVEAGSALRLSTTAESINALTGGGLVDPNSPFGGSATLTVGISDGSGTFSGTLANNGGQVLSLTKNGSGNQGLSGSSSYTGLTTVNEGTLTISNSNALGGTGAGTIVDNTTNATPGGTGTALAVSGGITTAEPLTLQPGAGRVSIINTGGNNTLSGPITIHRFEPCPVHLEQWRTNHHG